MDNDTFFSIIFTVGLVIWCVIVWVLIRESYRYIKEKTKLEAVMFVVLTLIFLGISGQWAWYYANVLICWYGIPLPVSCVL